MDRRFLFVVAALASICILLKRSARYSARYAEQKVDDHAADAQWANEGGANPAPTV